MEEEARSTPQAKEKKDESSQVSHCPLQQLVVRNGAVQLAIEVSQCGTLNKARAKPTSSYSK